MQVLMVQGLQQQQQQMAVLLVPVSVQAVLLVLLAAP
jgi:hypothetical protein